MAQATFSTKLAQPELERNGNILMTGAGVKRGYVHGASDKNAERVTEKPVGPADFIATVYAAMGIDPDGFVEDAGGRLRPITPGGNVVREVLA